MRRLLVTCVAASIGFLSMAGIGHSGEKLGFAVSTLANPFFVNMKEAAEEKAKALGVALVVLDAQDSPEKQAEQVEDLLAQNLSLLIINPVDSNAIGGSVVAANRAGVPVVTVTRATGRGDVAQHLDIDNKEAGALDAQQMIKDLGGSGNIVILEGRAGAASAVDRQEGFMNAIKAAPGIKILASLTANYSREEGAHVMEDLLQAHKSIDAVYAHNDEMALGAVRAIAAVGLIGKIRVYGIDATRDALEAVKKGEMAATVQQQPRLQIETAIDSAMKVLKGEPVEKRVNIPLKLITRDTL